MAAPNNRAERSEDGFVPILSCSLERRTFGPFALKIGPVVFDLLEEMRKLTDLGQLNVPFELRPVEKIRPVSENKVLEGRGRRDEFDDIGQNFVVAELFGRRYSMVSVHYIIFILDLVEFYRRERTTFSHGRFDPLQPFRGDVQFQSKTVVEVLIASNTAHDPINRHGSNTPNPAVKSGFFLLTVVEITDRGLIRLVFTDFIPQTGDRRFQAENSHTY